MGIGWLERWWRSCRVARRRFAGLMPAVPVWSGSVTRRHHDTNTKGHVMAIHSISLPDNVDIDDYLQSLAEADTADSE